MLNVLEKNDRPEGRAFNAQKSAFRLKTGQAMGEVEDIFFREVHNAELFCADGGHSSLVFTGL